MAIILKTALLSKTNVVLVYAHLTLELDDEYWEQWSGRPLICSVT